MNIAEQFRAVIVRYLVAFAWVDCILDADGNESAPRGFATSGFLLEFSGKRLFITAGHLLHDFAVKLPPLQRSIVRASLLNPWAAESSSYTPVFVDYASLPQYFEDNDVTGEDLGMFRLPPDVWAALMERGATPIQEVQLHRPQDRDVTQYWICGVPSELTEADTQTWFTDDRAMIELEPFCFQVQPLNGVTGGFTPTTHPRFYASIPAEVPLGDLDAVSGAPIFSLTRNGAGMFDIWLEAIQAQWKKSVRNIAATPFPGSVDILQRGCQVLLPPESPPTGDEGSTA